MTRTLLCAAAFLIIGCSENGPKREPSVAGQWEGSTSRNRTLQLNLVGDVDGGSGTLLNSAGGTDFTLTVVTGVLLDHELTVGLQTSTGATVFLRATLSTDERRLTGVLDWTGPDESVTLTKR